MLIECKSIGKDIIERAKREAKGRKLWLHNIVVGGDEASLVYARSNLKLLRKAGFEGKIHHLENAKEKELLSLIESLNEDENVHGIMVNFPLPKEIDALKVREKISPVKDVDGINPLNYGRLLLGEEKLVPNTPRAIIEILERITTLRGKDVLIINRTPVVGKPLSLMLLKRDATPTVAHSKTRNLKDKTRRADIVIVAVGKPGFLTENMIKDGAIVIDVGINIVEGKIVGDADFESIVKKAYITPVPGGVGTVTNACLMENLVKATKLQGVI